MYLFEIYSIYPRPDPGPFNGNPDECLSDDPCSKGLVQLFENWIDSQCLLLTYGLARLLFDCLVRRIIMLDVEDLRASGKVI